VTDLAALAAELLPGAEWVAGKRPGRPIAWVRVLRARVPAFDALEPGDLVIAPATALAIVAPGPTELATLVTALAAVPVSGVVLVDAEPAVAAALREGGVAAIRVERTDPLELERSVVGYIVAGGAELERQASLLEAELRRRALEGGGVAALVGAVSGFLGRALALEAKRGEPLVVHAPPEVPGAAADAARYQARTGGPPSALRVPLPAAAGPGGALVVLGSEPVSELARVALPRVAGLLALELAREEDVRGATARARQAEPMPSAGPPWAVLLARQRQPTGEDDGDGARAGREELRRAIRLLAPARRMALRGDADSVELRLVAAGGMDDVLRLAEQVTSRVGQVVAISRPFAVAVDRPGAEAEARSTLEAALALEAPPRLARADRLAFYRMLGALHRLPDGPRLARAVLEPLLDARPDVRRERLETLRALLAHGGVGEAAAALGVHRNTVAYRLRRIEQATGWRLADPELRLPLAVALGLVQDDQL
jgi:PucR family transcriptional regulator, purine catabolism regulatory protein